MNLTMLRLKESLVTASLLICTIPFSVSAQQQKVNQSLNGSWSGQFVREDNSAVGPVSTEFIVEAGIVKGWHYQPQYLLRDVKQSGSKVTFWHEYNGCRADHSLVVSDFSQHQGESRYSVSCPGQSIRYGRIRYGM